MLRPAALALLVGLSSALVACQARQMTLAEVLPPASYASPWVLRDGVWSGEFGRAADALGDEAAEWASPPPERVWLAVYRHEQQPTRTLTVRAFGFASSAEARAAYERHRPAKAATFGAGDEACWTSDGVLVLWGRLVLDIFSAGAVRAEPEQAVYLLACIEKRMPPGLPDAPR